MGNLFSNKQTTQQSGSSTGKTENNLFDNPGLQNFLSQYQQQFSGAGGANVPVNQWQLGAANNQTSVPGYLTPGLNSASNIATNGLSTADINRFYNNNTDNYVKALQTDLNTQNARDLSGVEGQAARAGALTGTGTRGALNQAREGQTRAQAPIIEQARYKALQDAQQTALANQGQLIGAANTIGGLTNAATGANQGLGGLGQNIWGSTYQNTMLPYSLYNMGVQGYNQFGNLAGQTTSGTTSGTGTTTTTPSLGSVIAGGLGTVLSGWPSGGLFGGGTGGNSFSYTPALPGELPWQNRADGGAVNGLSTASAPNSLHEKVRSAYSLLNGLHKDAMSKGGAVEGYKDGSEVEPVPGVTSPGTTQWTEPPAATEGLSTDLRTTPVPRPIAPAARPVTSPGVNTDRPYYSDPLPEEPGGWFGHGIWAGRRATPLQNLGAALTSIGDGPFKGVGAHIQDMAKNRLQEVQLQRMMDQMELERRRLALTEAKTPAEIAHLNAQTNLATTQGDKEYLLDLEKQKAKYAKELELAKQKAQFDMVNEVLKGQPPAPGRYKWVPGEQ